MPRNSRTYLWDGLRAADLVAQFIGDKQFLDYEVDGSGRRFPGANGGPWSTRRQRGQWRQRRPPGEDGVIPTESARRVGDGRDVARGSARIRGALPSRSRGSAAGEGRPPNSVIGGELAIMNVVNRTVSVAGGVLLVTALMLTGCSSAPISAARAAVATAAPVPAVVAGGKPPQAEYPYVAPTGSMEQSIHAGQTVTAHPITDYLGRVGDIVVFRGPPGWQSAPGGAAEFLKRVVAVGGQTIQCCDRAGRVLRDRHPLVEPYLYYLPDAGPANQAPFGPVTVPPGMLWVMGDSRNNSADSRIPALGPVPARSVVAVISPTG